MQFCLLELPGPIYAFLTHLFTHLQRHSKVELPFPLMEMTVEHFANFILYQRMGEKGASDKSEKQKQRKRSSHKEVHLMKVERIPNQLQISVRRTFLSVSVEREYNC